MDTWVIVLIIAGVLVLLVVAVVFARSAAKRRADRQRAEAVEARQEARALEQRAAERERTAEEELERAERERAAARTRTTCGRGRPRHRNLDARSSCFEASSSRWCAAAFNEAQAQLTTRTPRIQSRRRPPPGRALPCGCAPLGVVRKSRQCREGRAGRRSPDGPALDVASSLRGRLSTGCGDRPASVARIRPQQGRQRCAAPPAP
jgi:hypothetical protein